LFTICKNTHLRVLDEARTRRHRRELPAEHFLEGQSWIEHG
jgi:hypothetical protein